VDARVAPKPLNSLIRVVASRRRFPNMCYANRVKYLHHQLRDPGRLPARFLRAFAARYPLVLLLFSPKRSQDSLWVNSRFALKEGGSEGVALFPENDVCGRRRKKIFRCLRKPTSDQRPTSKVKRKINLARFCSATSNDPPPDCHCVLKGPRQT
jgi:hypothetical protein